MIFFIEFVILVTIYFTAIEIEITGVKKLQINNFGRELIRDKSSRMCLWTMVVLRKKKLNCLQSDFNRSKKKNKIIPTTICDMAVFDIYTAAMDSDCDVERRYFL